MIAMLTGAIAPYNETTIIVTAGGVGYEVIVGRNFTLPSDGQGTIYTHLIHREDSMTLYGFTGREQREMFATLLKAQGIGPKLAMEVLSTFKVPEIIEILFTQDVQRLTTVSGLGRKKAEKLIFDLRDTIQKMDIGVSGYKETASGGSADALKALAVLGFSPPEALAAVKAVVREGMQTEDIIKEALRRLAKH
jgi:Holliday junction DNA helicase RuvA